MPGPRPGSLAGPGPSGDGTPGRAGFRRGPGSGCVQSSSDAASLQDKPCRSSRAAQPERHGLSVCGAAGEGRNLSHFCTEKSTRGMEREARRVNKAAFPAVAGVAAASPSIRNSSSCWKCLWCLTSKKHFRGMTLGQKTCTCYALYTITLFRREVIQARSSDTVSGVRGTR